MFESYDGVQFYYLRNRELNKKDKQAKKGMPIGCVAIRANPDGTINRGVSICSPKDRYDKNAGRGIAFKRLIKAETEKKSTNFGVYTGSESRKGSYDNPFVESSAYCVEPTKEEYRMLHKPDDI